MRNTKYLRFSGSLSTFNYCPWCGRKCRLPIVVDDNQTTLVCEFCCRPWVLEDHEAAIKAVEVLRRYPGL